MNACARVYRRGDKHQTPTPHRNAKERFDSPSRGEWVCCPIQSLALVAGLFFFVVECPMARSHHHQDTDAIEDILREKAEEIQELIAAIEAGAKDIDLLLAELLEGEPEAVRAVIVEKLRERMQTLEEEQKRELEELLAAQKQQVLAQKHGLFRRWLMWVMSEETLRRIRTAFLAQPILETQVKTAGEELARRGVIGITGGITVDRRELGQLNANISASQGQGKDQGKGRG